MTRNCWSFCISTISNRNLYKSTFTITTDSNATISSNCIFSTWCINLYSFNLSTRCNTTNNRQLSVETTRIDNTNSTNSTNRFSRTCHVRCLRYSRSCFWFISKWELKYISTFSNSSTCNRTNLKCSVIWRIYNIKITTRYHWAVITSSWWIEVIWYICYYVSINFKLYCRSWLSTTSDTRYTYSFYRVKWVFKFV